MVMHLKETITLLLLFWFVRVLVLEGRRKNLKMRGSIHCLYA